MDCTPPHKLVLRGGCASSVTWWLASAQDTVDWLSTDDCHRSGTCTFLRSWEEVFEQPVPLWTVACASPHSASLFHVKWDLSSTTAAPPAHKKTAPSLQNPTTKRNWRSNTHQSKCGTNRGENYTIWAMKSIAGISKERHNTSNTLN